jgi:hypothetical protein
MSENLTFYPTLGYTEVAHRSEHGFDRVVFRTAIKREPLD